MQHSRHPQQEQDQPASDHAPGQRLGKGMLYIGWCFILAALTVAFSRWEHWQQNPNRTPVSTVHQHYKEVLLKQNNAKHYVSSGYINGQEVVFLLDTGATDVVLSSELAQALKLAKGPLGRAQTANGFINVYATRLDSLQIGNIVLRDIRASINPAMYGNEVLLGMSALKKLEFIQRGDSLTLRQYLN